MNDNGNNGWLLYTGIEHNESKIDRSNYLIIYL